MSTNDLVDPAGPRSKENFELADPVDICVVVDRVGAYFVGEVKSVDAVQRATDIDPGNQVIHVTGLDCNIGKRSRFKPYVRQVFGRYLSFADAEASLQPFIKPIEPAAKPAAFITKERAS